MEAESAHQGPPYSPLLAQCLTTFRALESDLHKRGVLHLGIFGSVARGDYGEESDVDVIVQVDYQVFHGLVGLLELEDEFSQVLGRSVDVVSMGGLKSPKHDHIRKEMVLAF
jgi:predicted nucleotidyltransferase